MLALSAFAEAGAYTNHAGYAVSGVVVALDAASATISNETESVSVPLSIFPEAERRRLAADYVIGHPEAGADALLVPEAVRKAVVASDRAIRRSRLRAEKGLCSQEESDDFCAATSAAIDAWLAEEERKGTLVPTERRALRTVFSRR